jgi:aldose 1-epimerase
MATISELTFGTIPSGAYSGTTVHAYELTNSKGIVARVCEYGAMLTHLWLPHPNGTRDDVVLGFDKLSEYLEHGWYFGATVGRVANRIGNSTFTLDGKEHHLESNNGKHHLHGGSKGWDKVVWRAASSEVNDAGARVTFTHMSKDGEADYPGKVVASVTYTLTETNCLDVTMEATVDRTTLVNMAHHSYWNLSGSHQSDILGHQLQLFCDAMTPGEEDIPNGEIVPVKGSPFDFTTNKIIGQDLAQLENSPRGYDHNFVVRGQPNEARPVALLTEPLTGRQMRVWANQPGVQFYSGNYMDGSIWGKGRCLTQYGGLCLETQAFPNAINVPAWRDQVIVQPGKPYRHWMRHEFS